MKKIISRQKNQSLNTMTSANGKKHTFFIRKATDKDIDLLLQLGKTTFRETFHDTTTESNLQKYFAEHFTRHRLSIEINTTGSAFFLAVWPGEPAGYLKINFGKAQTEVMPEDHMELERIYVLKKFQQKRIGQTLLDHALHMAGQKGCNTVWLGVWEHNERAKRFYRKNGFKHYGQHIFKVGDDLQTDLLFRRNISFSSRQT
ncbi:MAG: GNAT family N-acetyltransferase [Bacteroidota bacterium]